MDGVEVTIVGITTIAGPILAVQAQKWIERATARRAARKAIFHALMTNRATRLNDDFIRALNQIDFEFSPKALGGDKDRAVIDAWRSLFGELSDSPSHAATDAERHSWNNRINDRLVALLMAMSKAVGYAFSEEQLRRGVYYPEGRVNLEQTQLTILDSLKRLLSDNSIPMKITEVPTDPNLVEAQLAVLKKAEKSYHPDGALTVKIIDDQNPAR